MVLQATTTALLAAFSVLTLTAPASASPDLATAALERTSARVRYDGSYRALSYPGGDVPANTGVCTDVLIRAYRTLGIDLQVLVHEDMQTRFDDYPALWGLSAPDRNIDHRRVPNLETFFALHGTVLPLTERATDYHPGDIVSWRLAGGLPHIGIVSPNRVPGTRRYRIVHNIGAGPREEDVLFRYKLNGHFRYPTKETDETAASTTQE